jgi:ADP-ribose pyrophosphatase
MLSARHLIYHRGLIIRHPGASVIVPFVSRDIVLMLRQFRRAAGRYLYEFPAGTRDGSESALSCARREIVEEAGFAARKFTLLGEIFPLPAYSTERISIFKAEGLVQKKQALDADEVLTVFSAGRKKLKALFGAGKIKDAKTICALAMIGWI